MNEVVVLVLQWHRAPNVFKFEVFKRDPGNNKYVSGPVYLRNTAHLSIKHEQQIAHT